MQRVAQDRLVDVLDGEGEEGPAQSMVSRRKAPSSNRGFGSSGPPGYLCGQMLGQPGNPCREDLLFPLGIGIVDVKEQTAPLQCLTELPGVVGGQDHDGLGFASIVPNSGMETWKSERISRQRLGLDLDPVHLVDEKDHRLLGANCLEERAGQKEVLEKMSCSMSSQS